VADTCYLSFTIDCFVGISYAFLEMDAILQYDSPIKSIVQDPTHKKLVVDFNEQNVIDNSPDHFVGIIDNSSCFNFEVNPSTNRLVLRNNCYARLIQNYSGDRLGNCIRYPDNMIPTSDITEFTLCTKFRLDPLASIYSYYSNNIAIVFSDNYIDMNRIINYGIIVGFYSPYPANHWEFKCGVNTNNGFIGVYYPNYNPAGDNSTCLFNPNEDVTLYMSWDGSNLQIYINDVLRYERLNLPSLINWGTTFFPVISNFKGISEYLFFEPKYRQYTEMALINSSMPYTQPTITPIISVQAYSPPHFEYSINTVTFEITAVIHVGAESGILDLFDKVTYPTNNEIRYYCNFKYMNFLDMSPNHKHVYTYRPDYYYYVNNTTNDTTSPYALHITNSSSELRGIFNTTVSPSFSVIIKYKIDDLSSYADPNTNFSLFGTGWRDYNEYGTLYIGRAHGKKYIKVCPSLGATGYGATVEAPESAVINTNDLTKNGYSTVGLSWNGYQLKIVTLMEYYDTTLQQDVQMWSEYTSGIRPEPFARSYDLWLFGTNDTKYYYVLATLRAFTIPEFKKLFTDNEARHRYGIGILDPVYTNYAFLNAEANPKIETCPLYFDLYMSGYWYILSIHLALKVEDFTLVGLSETMYLEELSINLDISVAMICISVPIDIQVAIDSFNPQTMFLEFDISANGVNGAFLSLEEDLFSGFIDHLGVYTMWLRGYCYRLINNAVLQFVTTDLLGREHGMSLNAYGFEMYDIQYSFDKEVLTEDSMELFAIMEMHCSPITCELHFFQLIDMISGNACSLNEDITFNLDAECTFGRVLSCKIPIKLNIKKVKTLSSPPIQLEGCQLPFEMASNLNSEVIYNINTLNISFFMVANMEQYRKLTYSKRNVNDLKMEVHGVLLQCA